MVQSASPRTLSAALGGSRELALFEAFALRPGQALSAVEAAKLSKVAWATAHRRISEWDSRGVLRSVGKAGKAPLYELNLMSHSIRILAKAINVAVAELLAADLMTESPNKSQDDEPIPVVELTKLTWEAWDSREQFVTGSEDEPANFLLAA